MNINVASSPISSHIPSYQNIPLLTSLKPQIVTNTALPLITANDQLYATYLMISDENKKTIGTCNITSVFQQYQNQNKSASASLSRLSLANPALITQNYHSLEARTCNRIAIVIFGRLIPWSLAFVLGLFSADYLSRLYLDWDHGPRADRSSVSLQLGIYALVVALATAMDHYTKQALLKDDTVLEFFESILDQPDELLSAIADAGQEILQANQSDTVSKPQATLVVLRKDKQKIIAQYNTTQKMQEQLPQHPFNANRSSVKKNYDLFIIHLFGRFLPWTVGVGGVFFAAKYITDAYLNWNHSANASDMADALFVATYMVGGGVIGTIDNIAKDAIANNATADDFFKQVFSKSPEQFIDSVAKAAQTILRIKYKNKFKKIKTKQVPSANQLMQTKADELANLSALESIV